MTRLLDAWRAAHHEQRLAAFAAFGLFVSMFLHWYSESNTIVYHGAAKATQMSLSAFQAFSFVEAAVLLVSAGVLAMLFARAEGREFHLPGGDGLIVMIAGGWTALLIFYRLLDKPGLRGNQSVTSTVGVEWGIFVALLLALGLVYAGARLRAAEVPGPPLRRTRGRRSQREPNAPGPARRPGEQGATAVVPAAGAPAWSGQDGVGQADRRTAARRPRFPPAPAEQMSFEDPPAEPR
jgi:hypothetical protein